MQGKIRAYFAILTVFLAVNWCNAEVGLSKCSHSFGDPSWKYSHTFYKTTHIMKSGTDELKIHLPKSTGEMISFVCVHVPGLANTETFAEFSSLNSNVTVMATKPVLEDQAVHVVAKKHGY